MLQEKIDDLEKGREIKAYNQQKQLVETLQAKVDELEKEKEKFALRLADEKKNYEVKFKDGFNKLLE